MIDCSGLYRAHAREVHRFALFLPLIRHWPRTSSQHLSTLFQVQTGT